MTSAETCRVNGWKAGDIIQGMNSDSGDLIRVRITAIGRVKILAVMVDSKGKDGSYESSWTLGCRLWRKVGEA